MNSVIHIHLEIMNLKEFEVQRSVFSLRQMLLMKCNDIKLKKPNNIKVIFIKKCVNNIKVCNNIKSISRNAVNKHENYVK